MPMPNHCMDCDKPMQNDIGLCDDCYCLLLEESKTTADEHNKELFDEGESING